MFIENVIIVHVLAALLKSTSIFYYTHVSQDSAWLSSSCRLGTTKLYFQIDNLCLLCFHNCQFFCLFVWFCFSLMAIIYLPFLILISSSLCCLATKGNSLILRARKKKLGRFTFNIL